MVAAYLIDDRGPVVGASLARPHGKLHRAMLHRGGGIWAGCGNAQKLDEKTLQLADGADESRFCRASGCMARRR